VYGTRAAAPTLSAWLQPTRGDSPPEVFRRWIKVVFARMSPPLGPRCVPTAWSSNQGIALEATNLESVETPFGAVVAQTALHRVGTQEVRDDLLLNIDRTQFDVEKQRSLR